MIRLKLWKRQAVINRDSSCVVNLVSVILRKLSAAQIPSDLPSRFRELGKVKPQSERDPPWVYPPTNQVLHLRRAHLLTSPPPSLALRAGRAKNDPKDAKILYKH